MKWQPHKEIKMPFVGNRKLKNIVTGGPPVIHPQLQGCLICLDAPNAGNVEYISNRLITLNGACDYVPNQYWDILANATTASVQVASSDLAMTDPALVVVDVTLPAYNSSTWQTPTFFSKARDGTSNLRIYLTSPTTSRIGVAQSRDGTNTNRESRANGVYTFNAKQQVALGWDGDGNPQRIYKNGVQLSNYTQANITGRTDSLGDDFCFMNHYQGYNRSIQSQLSRARVYNLNLIDTVTYPTTLSLVEDIYTNPDAPFQ